MSRHSIPAAIEQALIERGVLSADRLGRDAQLRRCLRCRRLVVVGYDGDRAALLRTVDPVALDYPVGEAAALLTGRSTYELFGRELHFRDQFAISAGNPRPLVADHECERVSSPSPEILDLFTRSHGEECQVDPPF